VEGNSAASDALIINAPAGENEPPPTPPPLTPVPPTLPLPTFTTTKLPSPELKSPSAKRTRRRPNEVELLRDWGEGGELLLSPQTYTSNIDNSSSYMSNTKTTQVTSVFSKNHYQAFDTVDCYILYKKTL
jgi:hypothetical protein